MEILLRRCDNSGGQLEGKPSMMHTSSLTYPSADFTREKDPDRRQTTLENTDFWVIFLNIKLKMFHPKLWICSLPYFTHCLHKTRGLVLFRQGAALAHKALERKTDREPTTTQGQHYSLHLTPLTDCTHV